MDTTDEILSNQKMLEEVLEGRRQAREGKGRPFEEIRKELGF